MPTLKRIFGRRDGRATVTDIRAIVGPLDDVIVRAILYTGATPGEVTQAFQWLEESYYTQATFARHMDEPVRGVYDILDYQRNGSGEMSHRR